MNKINIYELDGIWVAAANVKDAIKGFTDIGFTIEEMFDGDDFVVETLTKTKLDSYIYTREDDTTCTFAQQLESLVADGTKFPVFFAADSTY